MSRPGYPVPYSRKVFVAESKIHGFGVITKRDIKKGEIIFIIKGKLVSWKVRNENEALYGENWIGLGKNLWIDPTGFGWYLNHSSKPNCGIRGKVCVCAMKDIKKGQEITIDYSTTEEQPLWWFEDNGGNKGKKVIVRSIQHLPESRFEDYLPYIPHYFQKVYYNYHKANVKRSG